MGAKPKELPEIDPIEEKVFVQKKSKKTKKASAGLGGERKITTGHPGFRRNAVIGSLAERRLAKMGGEILTAKPGVEGLSGTQVSLIVIEKKEKVIEKHLSKSKKVSKV